MMDERRSESTMRFMRFKSGPAVFIALIFISCQQSSQRKIRLAEAVQTVTRVDEQLTTTIHLEPSQQRSIAVMFFNNRTGDSSLEWLQHGLSEMFIRALSQSRHLSVLGQDRLIEIMERLESAKTQPVDMKMAAVVAKEANVEVLLKGNILKNGESLQLNVQLIEPYEGLILREESIEGHGLETILSMVDQLSQKIQNDLEFTLDTNEPIKGIAELSTHSLAAWKEFTTGNELCTQVLINDAITHFRKAIELDSTFVSPYLKLRNCYVMLDNQEMAYTLYQMAEKLKDRATKQELFQLSSSQASFNGDIEKLLSLYEEWLSNNPSDIETRYELANYYFILRNYSKAIDCYRKIVQTDPKHRLSLNQLGYSYALTGDYKKAIGILKKYQQTVPDESNPYDSMAEIYLFQGDYRNARKYYEMALKKNPDFYLSLSGLTQAAIDEGNYKQALQYLEKLGQSLPEEGLKTKMLLDKAGIYYRMGDIDKALELYQEANKSHPSLLQAVYSMADIYRLQGDSLRADQLIRERYSQIRSHMQSDHEKKDYVHQLAELSLNEKIEPEKTLQIIDSTLTMIDNPIQILRIQFLKTLLLIRLKRFDEIQTIWKSEYPRQFMAAFQNVQNIGYLEIWNYFHILNDLYILYPDEGVEVYKKFIRYANDLGLHFYEAGFRGILADLYTRTGRLDKAADELKIVGMPTDSDWMVIGPFDNKDGFNRRYPPEKEVDLKRSYRKGDQEIAWKPVHDENIDGYINLMDQYEKSDWSVAYALITIESPGQKQVQFRTGSNESIKIWLNGNEVWRLNRIQDAIIDDQITNVTLNPGKNLVLLKICNRIGNWGFYFRVADNKGSGIQDIHFLRPDSVSELIS
jgi:tetratricopeptide (TPR) repeat protein